LFISPRIAGFLTVMSTKFPKPRSEVVSSNITKLPELTFWRRVYRRFFISFLRVLVWVFTSTEVHGIENIPKQGPALFVGNHLGDADLVIGFAVATVSIDTFIKAEIYDIPILGKLLDAYGVIWIHRGQPDRRALRAAFQGFEEGRVISIAPEGRESLTGGLEEGTGGAAYLAYKAKVPVLPSSFVGTENARIFGKLKRLRRPKVSVRIGELFWLDEYPNRKQAVNQGTQQIMQMLADLLPPEYRGVYRSPETHATNDTKIEGNGT
jgi:1-acyl-sn-glycerol-3-phosphate acyltransferase